MASGWQGSTRNQDNPRGWKAQRRRIFARDRGVCYLCHQPGADEIDHVIARGLGGSHDDSNLAAVHKHPCHARKTASDAAKAKARRPPVASRRRPRERHPGFC